MLIKRKGESGQCPMINKQIKVDNGGCLYATSRLYTETLVAKKIIIEE